MKIGIKPIATPKYIRDKHGMVVLPDYTPVYTEGQMIEFAEKVCREYISKQQELLEDFIYNDFERE